MHASQREALIFDLIAQSGFITFKELEREILGRKVKASPATIRRDLDRLEGAGRIQRMHGGARLVDAEEQDPARTAQLQGVPFHENIGRNRREKEAIGRAAAALCVPGEGVMIDGGSTTLQMCPHLAGLNLQVLTNSLHIVSSLLAQQGTRILVPSGTVFREQNIILAAAGEESMPRFHAPKLFMGAAAIGAQGLMQADVILVAAERKLIEKAETIIVLVDSSKFEISSGNVVCELADIDIVITDGNIPEASRTMLEAAGVDVVIAS